MDIITSTVKSFGLRFVSITEPTFTPFTETSEPRVSPPIDEKFVNKLYPEILFVFAVKTPQIRKYRAINNIANPAIVSSGFLFLVRAIKKSKKDFVKFFYIKILFSHFITPTFFLYIKSQNMSFAFIYYYFASVSFSLATF